MPEALGAASSRAPLRIAVTPETTPNVTSVAVTAAITAPYAPMEAPPVKTAAPMARMPNPILSQAPQLRWPVGSVRLIGSPRQYA